MKQRPLREATSARLPRHAALAYLFLVRPHAEDISRWDPLFISILVVSAYAAQAQSGSRFDGIWTGTETTTRLKASWDPKDKGPSTSRDIQIIIAQNGTLVGITGGFCECALIFALSPLPRLDNRVYRAEFVRLQLRPLFVPVRTLLVGVRDLENARFIERFGENL